MLSPLHRHRSGKPFLSLPLLLLLLFPLSALTAEHSTESLAHTPYISEADQALPTHQRGKRLEGREREARAN